MTTIAEISPFIVVRSQDGYTYGIRGPNEYVEWGHRNWDGAMDRAFSLAKHHRWQEVRTAEDAEFTGFKSAMGGSFAPEHGMDTPLQAGTEALDTEDGGDDYSDDNLESFLRSKGVPDADIAHAMRLAHASPSNREGLADGGVEIGGHVDAETVKEAPGVLNEPNPGHGRD